MYVAHIAEAARIHTSPTVLSPISRPPSTTTPIAASARATALRPVRVIAAATAIGPMNSIATLLPRSVRARPMKKNVFINAVAIPNTAAAASCGRVQWRRAPGETRISTTAAPATRNQATVCGATSSNSSVAIVAPVYWAIAESMNSGSGAAVSR